MEQQKIYTVEQVAKIIGVHPATITRRILDGKLKAFRTNGESGPYRITEEALQAFQQYRENYPHEHGFPVPTKEVAEQGV